MLRKTENISKFSSGAMKLSDVEFTQVLEIKSMFVKFASITNYFFGGQQNDQFISHSI